jgi:ubiquinone/menaquinone biosynthesis C-methylase UbiE
MIANAIPVSNAEYRVALAEESGLDSGCADIVTVATAIHWLDTARFYPEVRRVLKPGGVIAVWSYAESKISDVIDNLMLHFADDLVGKHWPVGIDKARNFDEAIALPFETIIPPRFVIEKTWTAEQYMNYLFTWSSVQNYIRENDADPVDLIRSELLILWGSDERKVKWDLKMKVGRL